MRTTLPDSCASCACALPPRPSGVSLTVAAARRRPELLLAPDHVPGRVGRGAGAVVDLQTLFHRPASRGGQLHLCTVVSWKRPGRGQQRRCRAGAVGPSREGRRHASSSAHLPPWDSSPCPHTTGSAGTRDLAGSSGVRRRGHGGWQVPASEGEVGGPLSLYTTTGGVTTQATGASLCQPSGEAPWSRRRERRPRRPSASDIFIYGLTVESVPSARTAYSWETPTMSMQRATTVCFQSRCR